MPNLPPNCRYPACTCTYPNCKPVECEKCGTIKNVSDRTSIDDPNPTSFFLCDNCTDDLLQEQVERKLEDG
jgi:hypothetical protein